MNDIEITKRCANAMGYSIIPDSIEKLPIYVIKVDDLWHDIPIAYDPLMNDEQAFTLVKKFGLNLIGQQTINSIDGKWEIHGSNISIFDVDVNRAICRCIAEIQGLK
jgi:hypothetical protein